MIKKLQHVLEYHVHSFRIPKICQALKSFASSTVISLSINLLFMKSVVIVFCFENNRTFEMKPNYDF